MFLGTRGRTPVGHSAGPRGERTLVAIQHRVLGAPSRDNALLARVSTGQANSRLLFDCGEGCLAALSATEIRLVDALCFSHLHIDHVAGFDAFLRLNFARPESPVLVFGPAGTTRAIHHRLRGVTWNLIAGQPGAFRITDVRPDRLVATRFRTAEAFEPAHPAGEVPFEGVVYEAEGVTVEARIMDHGIPCLAYAVRERPRTNVDVAALAGLGLKPGRWIQALKDPERGDEEDVVTDVGTHRLGELRRRLLMSTPGTGLAYLTDFGLDDRAERELADWLRGCEVIVGEASYRDADAERARPHRRLTGSEICRLAAAVGARKLVRFHLSDRYMSGDWKALLGEVRRVFPAASFPSAWGFA
jgi:ribonuclease Z